jgi:hypothetical protein
MRRIADYSSDILAMEFIDSKYEDALTELDPLDLKVAHKWLKKWGAQEFQHICSTLESWYKGANRRTLLDIEKYHRSMSELMNLRLPNRPLYRGLSLLKDHKLLQCKVGDRIKLKEYQPGSSWSLSKSWAEHFTREYDGGITIKLLRPIKPIQMLVVPPEDSKDWFNEVFSEVTDTLGLRDAEREYLMRAPLVFGQIVYKNLH